jgi:hypothetical protein
MRNILILALAILTSFSSFAVAGEAKHRDGAKPASASRPDQQKQTKKDKQKKEKKTGNEQQEEYNLLSIYG